MSSTTLRCDLLSNLALITFDTQHKELRAMVSRAFHQLSNNKREIVKFDSKGSKSYNYGLSAWINESGEANEQFLPKLFLFYTFKIPTFKQ